MYNTLEDIRSILYKSVDSTPERVAVFFKRDFGDYAEFDQFLGITVPTLRKIAKKFIELPFVVLEHLLKSNFNEERLLAFIILVLQYQKADMIKKEDVYQFYIKHLNCVNNWNLVDNSAHLILGAHLWNRERNLLVDLAKSKSLWERRISIVATWYFIKRQDFECTIKISSILLDDSHDLIHKATGWMLREVGKQNQVILTGFLEQHLSRMPRTMLRYAIERLPENQRKNYLLKK